MKKSERISALVTSLSAEAGGELSPYYLGYFTCFNEGRYYEAHDVLEQLWLPCRDEHALFYKGLIQIAGAFVHLQKQYLRPEHPKDGRRLGPAVRLFRLGQRNLQPYGAWHLGLDLTALEVLCEGLVRQIEESDFARNPWRPEQAPQLHLGVRL